VSSTRIWKRQDKAARTIQTAFREYIRWTVSPQKFSS
jgi:hypothetical protein